MSSLAGGLVRVIGIDGAGKTTLAANLAVALQAEGVPAVVRDRDSRTGIPGHDSRLDALARMLWSYDDAGVLRTVGDLHLWFLFLAWLTLFDRVVLAPEIAAGRLVVTDASWHKYAARFQIKEAFPQALLGEARHLVRTPDLLLMLEAEPGVALARKVEVKVTEHGRLDDPSAGDPGAFVRYQEAVQARMRCLAPDAHVISARGTAAEVCDAAMAVMRPRFGIGHGAPVSGRVVYTLPGGC